MNCIDPDEYFQKWEEHIDGIVHERRNSSTLAIELRLSCTTSLIYKASRLCLCTSSVQECMANMTWHVQIRQLKTRLYHITSHHIKSYIISYHITSHHIASHHITSHHIIYHIISYQGICIYICINKNNLRANFHLKLQFQNLDQHTGGN